MSTIEGPAIESPTPTAVPERRRQEAAPRPVPPVVQRRTPDKGGTLKKSTRLLVALGSVALAALYFVPIWRIDLQAPQYPEGLGLRIWLGAIRGVGANDLRNINTLNHYIGMRPIDAASLPELQLMPFFVAGLLIVGLLAALVARRWLLVVWTVLILLAALAGLADFYRWGYVYGHDLDPNAIIKVPGMTYQPPVIGTKQLLNFRATSWPDIGGAIAIAVGLLAVVLSVRELRRKRAPQAAAAAAAILLLAGCAPQPRPIAYGEDACALCRMVVAEDRYGAELVARTGRIYTFDSIECLATFYRDSIADGDVASVWVTSYTQPRELIDAERAVFLHSTGLRSPMGADLTAFADSASAREAQQTHGGELMSWAGAQQYVARSWQPGMHGPGGHHGAMPPAP